MGRLGLEVRNDLGKIKLDKMRELGWCIRRALVHAYSVGCKVGCGVERAYGLGISVA